MPTYEYECLQCGHEFELFQKITDPPRKRCPKCRGTVRRKVGAGAGIIFKGSGFYQTDYRSEEYRKKAKEETTAPSGEKAKKNDSAGKSGQGKAGASGSGEKSSPKGKE